MLMTTMLAQMPDLRRRVQTDHGPGHDGRCRECSGVTWPCELFEIAATAEEIEDAGECIPSQRRS